MASQVVVLDNGGASIKAGFAQADQKFSVFPNATAKVKGERNTLVADQVAHCADISAVTLRRPIDRGYVVNWDLEKLIWGQTFRSVLNCEPKESGLILTEPIFNLPAARSLMDQVVFEDFQFPHYMPISGPELSLRSFAAQQPEMLSNRAMCGLIIDCGFSFTHVVPIFDGQVLQAGIRRINLGGKALTNYFKELVSYRSINMMEETYLVDHIKEECSFVSQDLAADLVAAKAGKYRCEYVLPDGISNGRGYLRPPLTKEQQREAAKEGKEVPALQLNNERFMVPELIFRPTDIAMDQAGLAEAIVQSAKAVHPDLRPLLYANVVCTGGTASCPGFTERLLSDLRPLVPAEIQVCVQKPHDPVLSAWQGGALLGRSHQYGHLAFTRSEYEERGSSNMRHQRGA